MRLHRVATSSVASCPESSVKLFRIKDAIVASDLQTWKHVTDPKRCNATTQIRSDDRVFSSEQFYRRLLQRIAWAIHLTCITDVTATPISRQYLNYPVAGSRRARRDIVSSGSVRTSVCSLYITTLQDPCCSSTLVHFAPTN